MTDYLLGHDSFHNGAFMLAANFGFYMGLTPRLGDPSLPVPFAVSKCLVRSPQKLI